MLCVTTIGSRLIIGVLCSTSNHFLWMTKLHNDTNGEYTWSCGEYSHRRTEAMEGDDGEMLRISQAN
jgi:hypothetical protein